MNFWENAEYVREFREMTLKELAYKADFSINSISAGITRGSFPAVDDACRIQNLLKFSNLHRRFFSNSIFNAKNCRRINS